MTVFGTVDIPKVKNIWPLKSLQFRGVTNCVTCTIKTQEICDVWRSRCIRWRLNYKPVRGYLITVSRGRTTACPEHSGGKPWRSRRPRKGRTPGTLHLPVSVCCAAKSLRVGWHWHWVTPPVLGLVFAIRSRSQPQQKCFGERRTASFPASTPQEQPGGGARTTTRLRQVETSHIYNSRALSLVDGLLGCTDRLFVFLGEIFNRYEKQKSSELGVIGPAISARPQKSIEMSLGSVTVIRRSALPCGTPHIGNNCRL